MKTLILFCLVPILSAVMDTLKDKWEFYKGSFYETIGKLLTKLRVFSSKDEAAFWFNSTGESWRNAYIDKIKDDSKPNQNKIIWNFLGFKFPKPAPFVDAWHYTKLLLIIVVCTIVAINLPILFLIINIFITRVIYTFLISIIWGIIFQFFYNSK